MQLHACSCGCGIILHNKDCCFYEWNCKSLTFYDFYYECASCLISFAVDYKYIIMIENDKCFKNGPIITVVLPNFAIQWILYYIHIHYTWPISIGISSLVAVLLNPLLLYVHWGLRNFPLASFLPHSAGLPELTHLIDASR